MSGYLFFGTRVTLRTPAQVLCSFAPDLSIGLAGLLTGFLGHLSGTSFCSLVHSVSLAQCFIGFCPLFRHT
jgi:hypothetical protein